MYYIRKSSKVCQQETMNFRRREQLIFKLVFDVRDIVRFVTAKWLQVSSGTYYDDSACYATKRIFIAYPP